MSERRTLVVGSGAGGLTLALLLARAGRPVTLIEQQPEIGGYLRRFTRDGLRFDTGYHFSGGFNGVMRQMTRVLGIDDRISAEPITNRIVLEESGDDLLLEAGCGLSGTEETLCRHFPDEAAGVRRLTAAIREIWEETPMHDLRDLAPLELKISRYDLTTVREFCDSLGLSRAAETAAGSFAMCHGTPISDAPMNFHGRIGFSLYDRLSRPYGGGDPMLEAFRREAAKLGIEIRTGTVLRKFPDADFNGECHEARLSDDSTLAVDQVFFAAHPRTICELLPDNLLPPSFRRRVRRFRESTAFFCAYYTFDADLPVKSGLVSYFSCNDLDTILRDTGGHSTGFLIDRENDRRGRLRGTVAAFRTMRETNPRFAVPHRERLEMPEYQEFKERITGEITAELESVVPELKGRLHPVAAGSPLTCLDYDPPTGSAYGVCCVCGESRLCGRLPVGNIHLAGQSALVPGVMGTMLTSFTVFRLAVGEETYRRIIKNSGIA